jgi:hypothetical protein
MAEALRSLPRVREQYPGLVDPSLGGQNSLETGSREPHKGKAGEASRVSPATAEEEEEVLGKKVLSKKLVS